VYYLLTIILLTCFCVGIPIFWFAKFPWKPWFGICDPNHSILSFGKILGWIQISYSTRLSSQSRSTHSTWSIQIDCDFLLTSHTWLQTQIWKSRTNSISIQHISKAWHQFNCIAYASSKQRSTPKTRSTKHREWNYMLANWNTNRRREARGEERV